MSPSMNVATKVVLSFLILGILQVHVIMIICRLHTTWWLTTAHAQSFKSPHFFPKKLMIFPCPVFATGFFAFTLATFAVTGLAFTLEAATSSSASEYDSQACSSRVTVLHQSVLRVIK